MDMIMCTVKYRIVFSEAFLTDIPSMSVSNVSSQRYKTCTTLTKCTTSSFGSFEIRLKLALFPCTSCSPMLFCNLVVKTDLDWRRTVKRRLLRY